MKKIAISSGHGKYVAGASGYVEEHPECVRIVDQVYEYLTAAGVPAKKYEDTVSHSQNENLNRLVDWHNSQTRDLDVSVHLNCNVTTTKPMGTECLYVTQEDLADRVAEAVALEGGFIDRGPKYRSDLFFLNNTDKPSILIETFFCDSKTDVELYNENFYSICRAIAQTISEVEIPDEGPRPPQPPIGEKPVLGKGDEGPYVEELQRDLNRELANCHLIVDGDFGSATDTAVRDYQRSRALDVDGIVGEQTWMALDTHMPPYTPAGLPPPLTITQQDAIARIAINSAIANYSWQDRGRAPAGYIKGFALSFANTYLQWAKGYLPAIEMAKANTGNSDKDVLAWYESYFVEARMFNTEDGRDTLRHLWALMLGLGMRESSGRHCEGRDQSADNVSSDTAEAGLFQTSYNAHSCSSQFDLLFETFSAGGAADNPQGFIEWFEEGVSCSSSSWQNYGSGNGAEFQDMCKHQPAFACETCAIVLRKLRQHYGPINRYEAELRTEADDMLMEVQDYIDGISSV